MVDTIYLYSLLGMNQMLQLCLGGYRTSKDIIKTERSQRKMATGMEEITKNMR